MIPSSIRWRLPLSYAATALLAALLLGAILLLGLRGYYSRRESDYLRNNATAVASTVSLLAAPKAAAGALQPQVELMAFLSQVRVRITDLQGNVVADSGDPRDARGLGTLSVGLEVPGASQSFTQTIDSAEGRREFTSRVDFEESGPQGSKTRTKIDTSVVIVGEAPDLEGRPGGLGSEIEPISLVPAVGAQLGLDLGRTDAAAARRSDKVARQPYRDEIGTVAGYVELSQGLAFGTEVLSSVARGWAVSGALAVVLAGAAGWLMSLRITGPLTGLAATTARMSKGELSARAEVGRGDELGQLATSFNEMAGRVEATVDALQRFVGDAAHQLLTPLTALRTDFDALQRHTQAVERAALVCPVRPPSWTGSRS
jgi:HAMP domain-containing protein